MNKTEKSVELAEIKNTLFTIKGLVDELVEDEGEELDGTPFEWEGEHEVYGVRLAEPYSDYSATREGKIFSFKRKKIIELNQTVASQTKYLFVRLYSAGVGQYLTVHNVICTAFHGPMPEDKQLVRHLDGNKLNNHADNLRYGTYKDNAEDAVRHGSFLFRTEDVAKRIKERAKKVKAEKPVREKRVQAKRLTNEEAYHTKALKISGLTYKQIREQYYPNVSISLLCAICSGTAYEESGWPPV